MPSIDLKKVYRDHYTAKRAPSIVEVPSEVIPAVTATKDLA